MGPRPGDIMADRGRAERGVNEGILWRHVTIRRAAQDEFGWSFEGELDMCFTKGHKKNDGAQLVPSSVFVVTQELIMTY